MYGRGERVLAWSPVAVQLVLLAGLVWLPGHRAWPTPGWLIAVAVVAITAAIYSAIPLGGAGLVALGGRIPRGWAWLALLGLLLAKTWLEERKLAARFPGYRSYAAATPRLVPDPLRCWNRLRSRSDRLGGDPAAS